MPTSKYIICLFVKQSCWLRKNLRNSRLQHATLIYLELSAPKQCGYVEGFSVGFEGVFKALSMTHWERLRCACSSSMFSKLKASLDEIHGKARDGLN